MDALARLPLFSDWLSIVGLLLTVTGFGVTIVAAMRARSAAEAARDAAQAAASTVKKLDLIGEIATTIQLVEELKRLHRSKAVELLADRYGGIRAKLISMREQKVVSEADSQVRIQDVIARISSLERAYDRDSGFLEKPNGIARANESLGTCLETLLILHEHAKLSAAVTI